ncbi:phage tail protein [Cronobacter muytjensii]|uniref:phage tail protein n=1 Tax=Cronobacter muytjensii TaxID=413501 RepID=UPI002A0E317D|nr:phage tail protein [Cronobacter muytjensii]ELY6275289.1 phage tail protein [Cronobacter muytjensii]MEB8640325.1 phage tail protein [Cronobacter muytjensii]
MTAKYFALLTNQGAARLANAAALGTKLNLTQLAVGDGGGSLPTPDPAQTKLINQKRIAPLNMLSVDPVNTSQIIAEQIIPESEGGYWIREIGLYDDAGVLIAVANCPETYKPQLQEGSGRTQTIRMVLVVSATDAVALKIDPSVVLATRKYVDDKVIEVKLYIDQLMEQHVKAADPHTQYAPKASPALTGKPTAPTPAQSSNDTQLATTAFVQAGLAPKAPLASPALTGTPTAPTPAQTVNNTQIATTAFVKAAIAALVASSPAALDTLSELAAALGNDANFAATMTKALAGKQPLDGTLTDLSGKDAAAIISYLGLGSAAKLNVGNAAGQIPDMSFFLSGPNWFRLPGGIIVQAFSGYVYSTDSDGTAMTFPVSFPETLLGLSVLWSDSSATAAPTFKYNARMSDKSKALVKVTNGSGSFGCVFIAVGR